jgi:hypothetical protein
MKPGEGFVIDATGTRRTQDAYPQPSEAHSAADLLRPLAADNARLQRRVEQLEADVDALEAALKCALAGRA